MAAPSASGHRRRRHDRFAAKPGPLRLSESALAAAGRCAGSHQFERRQAGDSVRLRRERLRQDRRRAEGAPLSEGSDAGRRQSNQDQSRTGRRPRHTRRPRQPTRCRTTESADPYASTGSVQDYQNNLPPGAQAYAAQGQQVQQQYQQYGSGSSPSMLTMILPLLIGGGMMIGGGSGGFGGGSAAAIGGPAMRRATADTAVSVISVTDAELTLRRVRIPVLIRPHIYRLSSACAPA